MVELVGTIIYGLVLALFAAQAAAIAKRKNMNRVPWALAAAGAAAFGFLPGVLVLWAASSRNNPPN